MSDIPDRPKVPRPTRSAKLIVMAVFGMAILGGYGALAYADRELFSTVERDEVPANVRSSPGGYRSFHFWHSGYHGGK